MYLVDPNFKFEKNEFAPMRDLQFTCHAVQATDKA